MAEAMWLHRLDVHGANPECRVRTRKGTQGGLKHSSVRVSSGRQVCKSRLESRAWVLCLGRMDWMLSQWGTSEVWSWNVMIKGVFWKDGQPLHHRGRIWRCGRDRRENRGLGRDWNGVEKVDSRNITEVECSGKWIEKYEEMGVCRNDTNVVSLHGKTDKESLRRVGRWGNRAFNPCYLTRWWMTCSGFITLQGFNQSDKS